MSVLMLKSFLGRGWAFDLELDQRNLLRGYRKESFAGSDGK